MRKLFWLFLGLLFTMFFAGDAKAEEANQFATIVNPVRISNYIKTPYESLLSEYKVVKSKNLPSTWLITFDVLENEEMVNLLKAMDENQELGIFLEVTKNFAQKSGVLYNDTGFWHHANSVFLSGYTQEERKKLIDKVFETFKEIIGYYPTSVGSWWTDSYSLSYMKEKYGIMANLGCSDQFATDGYQIWGQPWSIPFYPSKLHAGVPAADESVKLDLVNFQWAPRDPLNGYYSSMFSTQDYRQIVGKNLDIGYFEKLVNLYAFKNSNQFGQITVGLESDLSPDAYKGEYSRQLDYVKKLSDQKSIEAVTMKDFADWYRKKYPGLSPVSFLETDDLMGSGVRSVWSQNSKYRLFYTIDPATKEVTVRDLRFYNKNLEEPYYYSPNRSFSLTINIPAMVDEISFKESIKKFKPETSNIIGKFPGDKLIVSPDGILIKGLSSEAIHFFKQKRAILLLLSGRGWNYFKKVDYLIPQGEIYALNFLKKLSSGKVLVYDHECLQCEYHTKFKPPFIANIRSYVRKYGGRPVIYNNSIISNSAYNEPFYQPKTREEIKKELEKTKVKYIYLVKFESYFEKLPYSPGDLGVEKIFSNANSEIWRVLE